MTFSQPAPQKENGHNTAKSSPPLLAGNQQANWHNFDGLRGYPPAFVQKSSVSARLCLVWILKYHTLFWQEDANSEYTANI